MKRTELINVSYFNGTLALIFWVALGVTDDLSFLWVAFGLSLLMMVGIVLSFKAND